MKIAKHENARQATENWTPINARVDGRAYADRAEWFAIRRTGIGSSDAAAATGISEYEGKTPRSLFLVKTGAEPEPDLSDNEAVRIGIALEPVVADMYAERTGRRLRRSNRVLRDREHPYMLANIDRDVIGETRLVEIKTVGFLSHGFISPQWGEDGSPAVPVDVWAQAQHQMSVHGAPICDVVAFKAGIGLHVHPIERDDDAIAKMRIVEARFWQRVLANDPPEPSTLDEVQMVYPRHASISVEASAEIAQSALRWAELSARKNADEREIKALRDEIGGFLGEADTLLVRGEPYLTCRAQTRAAHAVKESTFRVVRLVKEKK
jgi:putative phage-type endonuclease